MPRPCRPFLAAFIPLVLATSVAVAADSGASVVISEFRFRGPAGGNDEFIEIHNRTAEAVDISGWLLRGSNSSGTTTTRATVASDTEIAPFGYYLFINTNSGPYSGEPEGDATFSSGIVDEGGVAIALPDGTIVDAVGLSAGSAYLEGTHLPSLGTGTSANLDQGYRRKVGPCGRAQDTDDNLADFEVAAPSTPLNSAMTGAVHAANGNACDDDNACTEDDACSWGSCSGTPRELGSDGNTCTEAVCDPQTGDVTHEALEVGTPCDDGNVCTTEGACDGEGACLEGEEIDFNDDNPCTSHACDPITGVTENVLLGESCDDGDPCTFEDACNLAGQCEGIAKQCSTPPETGCWNTEGSCEETTGECAYQPLSAQTGCDDGDACTLDDRCDGEGACGGTPKVCEPPPAECVGDVARSYSGGQCVTDGSCDFVVADVHCAFGCESGGCLPDPCLDVVCNTPPSSCHVEEGTCSGGACSYGLKVTGSACEDGDPCTIGDQCDAEGTCQPGDPKVCDASPSVCREQTGTCNSSTGECQYPPLAAHTPCDDGDACTDGETCDGDGSCVGATIACDAPAPECQGDESVTWSGGACDAGTGACGFDEHRETCAFGCDEDSGLCVEDPCVGVTCDEPDVCQTAGRCEDGECVYDPVDEGTTCDDDDPCTVADQCDEHGACAGTPVTCNTPPAAECVDANTSRSYASVGACTDGECVYEPSDVTCEFGCDSETGRCDGDACAEVSCNTAPGSCYLDVGECHEGSCSYAARPAGASCDDNDPCTVNDECSGAGTCAGTRDESLPGCGEVDPIEEPPVLDGGCGGCTSTGGTGSLALLLFGALWLGRRRRA